MFNDGDVITKVWMLLDIIHKASTAGPAYIKWSQAAQKELDRTEQHFSEEATKPMEETSEPKAIPSMETDNVKESS